MNTPYPGQLDPRTLYVVAAECVRLFAETRDARRTKVYDHMRILCGQASELLGSRGEIQATKTWLLGLCTSIVASEKLSPRRHESIREREASDARCDGVVILREFIDGLDQPGIVDKLYEAAQS